MATPIALKLTIGIPSEAVYYAKYTFSGGMKCSPNPTVDLDKTGAGSLTLPALIWSPTHQYENADAPIIADKPDWFRSLRSGAKPIKSATLQRTAENLDVQFVQLPGATHAVKFYVNGGNPLLPPIITPDIDATITVGLRKVPGGIEFCVDGTHDGFPNYVLQINGKPVYEWDAVAKGKTPGDLAFSETVQIPWRRL